MATKEFKLFRIQQQLFVFEVDAKGVMNPIQVNRAPLELQGVLADQARAIVATQARVASSISVLSDVEITNFG